MTEKHDNGPGAEGNIPVSEDVAHQESHRNFFDIIGDFFAKMLKGIFVFVFCKLPVRLWKILSDIEQLKKNVAENKAAVAAVEAEMKSK